MDISGQLVLWTWSLYVGLPSCPQSDGAQGRQQWDAPDMPGWGRFGQIVGELWAMQGQELIVMTTNHPKELLLFQ